MRKLICFTVAAIGLAGCSRNEPGTMGAGNEPTTVATGAPADAAKGSAVSDPKKSSIASEQAASTFDHPGQTNTSGLGAPDASTRGGKAQ